MECTAAARPRVCGVPSRAGPDHEKKIPQRRSVVYSLATPPQRELVEVSMDSNHQRRLSELRRELKEILSMIDAVPGHGMRASHGSIKRSLSNPSEVGSAATPTKDVSDAGASAADSLFDNALIIMTEFGQASPSILQMWLSIDYGYAMRLLSEFETQGLVSSRGKVRHKAYTLRRSKGLEFRL
jgi:DNA segregation ATPase FtsK/SpoIIIE-like protein